jgi:hypothetical protein
MMFKGNFRARTKVIFYNSIIHQEFHFSYLGCDITSKSDKGLNNKLKKYDTKYEYYKKPQRLKQGKKQS